MCYSWCARSSESIEPFEALSNEHCLSSVSGALGRHRTQFDIVSCLARRKRLLHWKLKCRCIDIQICLLCDHLKRMKSEPWATAFAYAIEKSRASTLFPKCAHWLLHCYLLWTVSSDYILWKKKMKKKIRIECCIFVRGDKAWVACRYTIYWLLLSVSIRFLFENARRTNRWV